MPRKYLAHLVTAVGLLGLASVAAAGCNSTTPDDAPTSRYHVNGNGTVTDIQDGLTWSRCALGQTWDAQNKTCSGSIKLYAWQDALKAVQALDQGSGYAGYTDWRLPNLRELMSLVRYHCSDPAINATVFPSTASIPYWSSSPFEGLTGVEWAVSFSSGKAFYYGNASTYAVRLVRAGAF